MGSNVGGCLVEMKKLINGKKKLTIVDQTSVKQKPKVLRERENIKTNGRVGRMRKLRDEQLNTSNSTFFILTKHPKGTRCTISS